jgi:hypothetical protein
MEVIVKKLIIGLSLLLIGGVASAAQITCRGEYFGYQFTARANSTGTRVVGKIRIDVRDGGGFHRSGSVRATSSDIRRGRYLRFAGRASDGSTGSVNANYNSSSRNYDGILHASTSMGSVRVSVLCTLRGSGREVIEDSKTGLEAVLEGLPVEIQ